MKVRQDPSALPGYNGKKGGERFRTILKYPIAQSNIGSIYDFAGGKLLRQEKEEQKR